MHKEYHEKRTTFASVIVLERNFIFYFKKAYEHAVSPPCFYANP
jgi:hypothetical protein